MELTSLNAYGRPKSPAPIKDIKIFAIILEGLVIPDTALPPAIFMV